jgi:hypothetical protein
MQHTGRESIEAEGGVVIAFKPMPNNAEIDTRQNENAT